MGYGLGLRGCERGSELVSGAEGGSRVQGLLPRSQVQTLALTLLYLMYSLDCDLGHHG